MCHGPVVTELQRLYWNGAQKGPQDLAAFLIPEFALTVHFHTGAVVIQSYDVAVEKAESHDPVDLHAIDAAQDLVIVDMKIEAVRLQTRDLKACVIEEFHVPHAADPPDSALGGHERNIEFNAGC